MKRGAKGNEAEALFHRWLEAQGWRVHRAGKVTMPLAMKGKCHSCHRFNVYVSRSHDIFGCFDFLAFQEDRIAYTLWAVQVTTQAGRSLRRRKIEDGGPWHPAWRVSLVSHEVVPDPANRSRRLHFWKVEDYDGRNWAAPSSWVFDPKALTPTRASPAPLEEPLPPGPASAAG